VKGADGTGNLLSPDNLQFCFDQYCGSMDFITGDGGFDFSCQYPWQEEVSAQLIYAQIAFAIAMQKIGGCFVIKMFDTFTKISLDLLYLLANVYTTIVFQKPQTSRSANSEKYVICSGFRLPDTERSQLVARLKQGLHNFDTKKLSTIYLFDLPYYFTNKVEEYNAVLGQQQLESIVSTITMVKYHTSKHDKLEIMKKLHVQKCINWCQTYNLPCIKTIDEQNIFLNGPRWNTAENTSADPLFATASASASVNTSLINDILPDNTSPKSNIYIPKFKFRANML
jgi:cap1 methyltransferase